VTTADDETDRVAEDYDNHPAHIELSLDGETIGDERLQLLLRDHESAGDDARYRDRLVYYGFYLALIFSGILIDTLLGLFAERQLLALFAVAAFGSGGFYVLSVWTKSLYGARNALWNRRRQIENEVGRHYPGLLKAHSDIFDRLAYNQETGRFEHETREGTEELSTSNLTVGFVNVAFLTTGLIAVFSLGVGVARIDSVGFLAVPVALLGLAVLLVLANDLFSLHEWLPAG
jgi:hypothetical protein